VLPLGTRAFLAGESMDIFVAKQVVKGLVLPPAGPLLIALLGLMLLQFSRWRRTGSALCAAGLLVLWLLSTPAISDELLRATERYPPLDLEQVPSAQAIVILAGGVRLAAPEYGTAAPNFPTLQRLTYGALLARRTQLPVLVSGNGKEAAAMRDSLRRDFGVETRWVESRSWDTRGNAELSAPILKAAGIKTILLVTSASHMYRAAAYFRAQGLSVVPAPSGFWTQQDFRVRHWVPSIEALWRSQTALYEDLGNLALDLHPPPAAIR
jgi:uncharacterized SAM-binding protein YcdF (DUF218 family)